MSAEETILNLFDSYWFEHRIFTPKPPLSAEAISEDNPKKLNRITTLIRKSHSDQCLSSKDSASDSPNSPSPKSVLLGPQLQTILSGKESENFEDSPPIQNKTRKKKRKSGSRSLSELEFEELKGFMDLGFVFTDEIRDSRLVSIIPGLQRLGKKNGGELDDDEVSVSRPYLSEAWDCLENPMKSWRIPDFGNEMELKDHLRIWAHSVASTVV